MGILSKLFGDANQRTIDQFRSLVAKINELEPQFERFSREELRAQTNRFKELVAGGRELEAVLAESFAAVREAAKRTLGQRHFDVQLIGGMVLHQGKIAEMKTGEGKTLVATLPAYLNALTGRGVHIVTVNDYLSRRDGVWMGQIYNALGLTVGILNHEASYLYDPKHEAKSDGHDAERDTTGAFRVVHEFLRPVTRREAYQADITYGTNNEFGFDYLRDNMVYDAGQMVQRGHHYAIVDEIDSILIDEARTPLIISAPDMESTQLYETFAKIVPRLSEGEDYNVDEKLRAVSIAEKGIEKIEKMLNLKNIYEAGGTKYVHHLEQALKAQILFHRDKDYVVKSAEHGGGEVIIVDEFTGRLMPGRRWSGGLHQAVEAKEKVLVQKESRTLGTITFQNYFRLYERLAGMTGTAQTSAEEFHKVYKLDVITVPTNKPMVRHDAPDRIYKSEPGKFLAVAQEIKKRHFGESDGGSTRGQPRHGGGQPVLVGTTSITKNELLAAYLNRESIPHKILNAKNHEQEGEIIAQAGRLGAVTVATNLAGRGVDIILGGNPPNFLESEEVKKLGGLHVIGTERHEARRIDNQLRGRSGRQGDLGSTQFFVSAEDELIRIFGGDRLKNLMERLGVGETEAIENSLVSRSIEQAQSKVEGNNFDIRKYVLEYDDVMNKHRTAIYELRKQFLISNAELPNNSQVPSAKTQILKYLDEVIERLVSFHTVGPDWNRKEIEESIKTLINKEYKVDEQINDPTVLKQSLNDLINRSYQEKESQVGADTMRQLEKVILLRVIDELWVDHLEQMEYLRDSVRLRAYGQRDPLIEYKIEGQRLFNELQAAIGAQVANLIFKVSATPQPDANRRIKTNAANEKETKSPLVPQKGIGRNDPCPCGATKPSGRPVKYKKCHGR